MLSREVVQVFLWFCPFMVVAVTILMFRILCCSCCAVCSGYPLDIQQVAAVNPARVKTRMSAAGEKVSSTKPDFFCPCLAFNPGQSRWETVSAGRSMRLSSRSVSALHCAEHIHADDSTEGARPHFHTSASLSFIFFSPRVSSTPLALSLSLLVSDVCSWVGLLPVGTETTANGYLSVFTCLLLLDDNFNGNFEKRL